MLGFVQGDFLLFTEVNHHQTTIWGKPPPKFHTSPLKNGGYFRLSIVFMELFRGELLNFRGYVKLWFFGSRNSPQNVNFVWVNLLRILLMEFIANEKKNTTLGKSKDVGFDPQDSRMMHFGDDQGEPNVSWRVREPVPRCWSGAKGWGSPSTSWLEVFV